MGNDNSKSDEERRQKTRHQAVSRAEVNRLLEQQKREYERKLQELNVRKAAASSNKPTHVARHQGVSRAEVNRLLEQQKREYERKLQELNVRKASASPNKPTHVAREATEANDRNIDQILAQQLQDFVRIAYNNNSPSSSITGNQTPSCTNHTASSNFGTQRSPNKALAATPAHLPGPSGEGTSTTSLERNRNPYNFTRVELQNRQSPASPQANLYPNLGTDTNFGNFTTNTPKQHNAFRNNGVNRDPDDFVFISNNKNAQGTQPSAPPPTPPTGAISNNVNTSKPSQFRPKPVKNEEEALNCRTCGKKYGLNIFQCSKGHSSCRDCKLNSVPCGICRGPIGDTRNIAMETYISERKAPCPNSDDGCSLLLKIADMDAHLKECPFREFVCPLVTLFGQREKCRWRGKLTQIVSHFDDVHPAHRQGNIDTEMILINILDNMHVVHLIDLAPYVFLVHVKVADEERKIYMTVQLLGTQISATKWSYELHVYNKREPRRKFQHTDVCHSTIVPLEEIFGEAKCAVIPQSYAMSYVNERCLNYKFYIKREFDPAPSTSRGKWRGGGRGRGRGRGARARGNS